MMKKIKSIYIELFNRFGYSGLFLLLNVFLLIITFLISPDKGMKALQLVINVFLQWWWIFLIVYIFMVLVDLFMKNNEKFMNSVVKGKHSFTFGWLFAIIGGILSTGPIYMWYPLLKKLYDKGLKVRYIVSFLYNRSIKLPLLPALIAVIGLKTSIILLIVMVLFSIINGILVEIITR